MSDWTGEEGEHWASNADRYSKMLAAFGDEIVDTARLEAGRAVLDVGCGNGDLSLASGRIVGSGGIVRGVDLSPAMVAVATRRARSSNLDHVEFAVADASSHRPNAGPFDTVASRFGVMFFEQPEEAFAHMHSMLAVGGELVFTCWQDPMINEWLTVPVIALSKLVPLPSGGSASPGPFSLSDPDLIASVLSGSGFSDIEINPVSALLWSGEDAADAAEFLVTTGLGKGLLAEAAPVVRDEAKALLAEALSEYQTDDGVQMKGEAWLVRATA